MSNIYPYINYSKQNERFILQPHLYYVCEKQSGHKQKCYAKIDIVSGEHRKVSDNKTRFEGLLKYCKGMKTTTW